MKRTRHQQQRSQAGSHRSFRSVDTISGRLVAHRDGYGFVIPDKPLPQIQGDIFIGQHSMSSAMHGDRVLAGNVRVRADGRAEGRIEQVLERSQATVVGRFQRGTPFNYVVPYDERITSRIIIPAHPPAGSSSGVIDGAAPSHPASRRSSASQHQPAGNVSRHLRVATPDTSALPLYDPEKIDGAVVDVEITRFPSLTQHGTGRIIEVLGREGEFGIDVGIIIRKHHLRHRFPTEVEREASRVSATIPAEELHRREDFREYPIVTIDGETARDFDDAVAVEQLPNGNYRLQVHIADVSYYVSPGSALDREARLRGTSVYFPDRAVPMLPPELSNEICSLKPAEDRLVLSVTMEIDHQGATVGSQFHEGVIRSAERMTYTAVNLVLENDPRMRERYSRLASHFEMMRDLALILNRKRVRRGSIDFDLPEPVIELDEFGTIIDISRSERNIAHRLIEEFMLAANETVASHIEQLGIASIYRIHEEPDPRKVIDFEEIAASFGYSLGVGALPVKRFAAGRHPGQRSKGRRREAAIEVPGGEIDISPRHYQRLTEKIAGKPEERILSYLMLRSLKQAVYRARNEGHFALATPSYTHFTSPIRRYPDLIVHRILRYALEAGIEPVAEAKEAKDSRATKKSRKHSGKSRVTSRHGSAISGPISQTELEEISLESSEAERRAQDAERELIEWKKARFMHDKLGEEFDALIISVNKFGFFVELMDLFVEGLVPIETMTDERYIFREQQRQWVGERSRRQFRMGDRLRVRLDRIGELGGKMSFSVAD